MSHNKVNIHIRRLTDSEHVHSVDEREIPSVLPVNILSAEDTAGPDEQQAVGPSNTFANLFDKASRKEKGEAQTTVMQTGNLKSKGGDVQISTYSADGRGAVSAALRKRSQSAPLRRNVTVQVLDQDRSQTPRGQSDPAFPLGDPGTSASVSAITAATTAATAPLIKAQREMEAQIALVTAELRRLQAAEGSVRTENTSAGRAAHLEEQLNILIQQRLQHLETIQCQQIQLQNRLLGSALDVVAARANPDSSGITQTDSLPVQISGSRSIRLFSPDQTSARSPGFVSKDVRREKQAGVHISPLDTPAPRKVIPKPTHWTSSTSTVKPQRSSLKNKGNGRLQDQSPNNRRSPERYVMQSVGVKRFAMATADNGQPERSRTSQTPPEASAVLTEEPAFMNPQNEQENQGEHIHVASSSSVVQRANQMLQDLGQIKNEMRSLMQTADAFPVQNAKSTQISRSSHLAPSATAPPPSTTPVSMPPEPVDVIAVRAAPLNRPSILKSIRPPTSMFEDAGLVLRQVRQSRKVLEENLEAILRAKDGEVLHKQLEALSKNRDVHEELRIKKTVDAWINTLSKEIQDDLARENSERRDAAVAKVVQQDQRSTSGRGGRGRGRGGGETSAAEKKTSLRGLVRTQAESTLAHSKQPTLSVRTRPEGKQETATEEPHAGEDQEENVFPGTNFLAVADISQETHCGLPDSPIELDGLPSPPAALYHGPAFPPQPSQSTHLTEPILSTIQQRETLENRLVDWVEQQLMARMITGMFPQPVQTDPASQSEPENSVTSDIVEAAGGGGLQLFVDTGVPVDSELIRQCVNEVLAETIAVMLGQRETERELAAPVQTQGTQEEVTTVPTPAPTPEPSLKEPPSPVRTPDLSEHLSTALSPKKKHQESASPVPDRIPVGTPNTTPIPSPIRVDTPSPPPANQSPESATLQHHPWGGTELPLEEEELHSEKQEQQPESVVMSVAQDDDAEEPVIPSSSPLPSKPAALPPPLPPAATPDSSSSSSSSSEESSTSSSATVTETEMPARHISEGELLLTHGQMAAVKVLEQEGVLLPNLITSLNSSLHGVQDMDYDPPSEGQVIRAPRLLAHHDPVLSLLARMERGIVNQSQQPERWWEEESSGEVSEGQRPLLTATQQSVMTGHSLIDQQRHTHSRTTEISPHSTLMSPGQVLAEVTGAVVEDSGLSVNARSSEEQKEAEVYHVMTVSSPQLQDTEHLRSQTEQAIHGPAPILVRQYEDKEEPEFPQLRRLSDDAFFGDNEKGEDIFLHADGGGSDVRVMSVRLPSSKQDQESVSLSSVEGDTDSSANDVF